MNKADSESWKKLADEKEKEWRGILELRIETLETQIQDTSSQLESERVKFNELKEHFKYNLKLLEDRDKELEKYDITTADLRAALNSKIAEISEMRIHLDDLKNLIKREEKVREELQANYQRRLREKQAEVDAYKSSKDGEIHNERKEYEQFRRNIQIQLINVQNELGTQKSELTVEFENALKKREHEFKVQCDELNAKALEYELKAKLLDKELELTRESNDKTVAAAEEAESTQIKLEKLVKQKDWELANCSAVKDSQIAELQSKLSSSETALKRMQDDFQRKYTEMDKLARDREDALERVKNGHLEREQSLQESILDLQSKLEDAKIRERQLTWSNQDLVKDKESQIEKLQEKVNDVKEKWDRHIGEISRENVNRDLELGTALEEQRRLKLELEQRKDDLHRYRNELKAAAEREEMLDKSKAQLELDWQRRYEDLERQQYDKSEDLIKKLTTAKNEAQALVKERERELHRKILLVKSLHRERDQLSALLKKHNISPDNFLQFSLDNSDDEAELSYVEDLQEENRRLKELVAQMRSEMESLGQDAQKLESTAVTDNVSIYEEETQNLKKQNQDLKEKLKSSKRVASTTSHLPSDVDNDEVLTKVKDNAVVKNHIQALNSAIGTLRSEKVELAATVKKQQARIAFLEHSLEDLSKQPRQKQIQIDQLTYEISSCRRQHEAEVSGLKSRVSELDFQLSEARREADGYHRASLERNEELVTLGNQLSALKLELSVSSPSINYGAQELYIQQLQDELSQLRKRSAAVGSFDLENISSKLTSLDDSSSRGDLKHKLRSAAARIIQLARENQQLTESNNRLRAELNATSTRDQSTMQSLFKPKEEVFGRGPESHPKNEGLKTTIMQDRLEQLEKLQYHLTRQELQFAQRFKSGSVGMSTKSQHSDSKTFQIPTKDDSESTHLNKKPVTASRPADVKMYTDESMPGSPDSQMMFTISSGGGESIQKVWQMLEDSSSSVDHSATPHSFSPPRAVVQAQMRPSVQQIRDYEDGSSFQVEGQRVTAEARSHTVQNTAKVYTDKLKKMHKPKAKVRNYNVKRDPKR